MAGVEMSRLKDMERKYASGRSASCVCVSLRVCVSRGGAPGVCQTVPDRTVPRSAISFKQQSGQIKAAALVFNTQIALINSVLQLLDRRGGLRPPFKRPVRNNNTYFIRSAGANPSSFNNLTHVEMNASVEMLN